jgi:hypothetical protein
MNTIMFYVDWNGRTRHVIIHPTSPAVTLYSAACYGTGAYLEYTRKGDQLIEDERVFDTDKDDFVLARQRKALIPSGADGHVALNWTWTKEF